MFVLSYLDNYSICIQLPRPVIPPEFQRIATDKRHGNHVVQENSIRLLSSDDFQSWIYGFSRHVRLGGV